MDELVINNKPFNVNWSDYIERDFHSSKIIRDLSSITRISKL